MAELSEAEKQEKIAMAAATQGSQPEAPVIVREEPVNTTKISAENFPAEIVSDALPEAPPRPMTPASGGGDVPEWGPYEDYTIINTGFGEYGLERGKILFFEPGQVFNKRAGQFMAIRIPRYRSPDQTREEAIEEAVRADDLRPVRG